MQPLLVMHQSIPDWFTSITPDISTDILVLGPNGLRKLHILLEMCLEFPFNLSGKMDNDFSLANHGAYSELN